MVSSDETPAGADELLDRCGVSRGGGGVVARAADVVVRARQRERGLGFEGQPIEPVLQDGLHRAIRHGPEGERAGAGGLQAGRGVALAEAEEPEAGAVALLRVRPALQDVLGERGGVGPGRRGPAQEARGRPLAVPLVRLGAVGGIGGVAAAPVAREGRGDAAAAVQNLDGARGEADIHVLAHQGGGHAVASPRASTTEPWACRMRDIRSARFDAVGPGGYVPACSRARSPWPWC